MGGNVCRRVQQKVAAGLTIRQGAHAMRRIVLLVGLAFMVSAIVADAQVPGSPETESPAIRQVGNTTILGDDPRNPGGNERITIKGDPTKVAAGTVTDEGIYFNYKEQDLINVIEAIAAVTGKNFNIDPGLNNVKVTVITHDPIPADMAMDVLENILASRGYALRETLDGFMIDVVSRDKERHKQEVFKGRELPPGYDRFSTHIVAVHNIDLSEDSAELANLLKSLGSDQASVDIYARTNTLIISDTSEGIRRMFALLEEIDIPGYETEMELITLEYTRAEVLATQINELLGEGEGGSPSSPTVPQPRRAVSPRSSTPLVIGAKEEILRIVPDERLNALIVVASENMMQQVLDLVERLDAPTDYESNNMHIYELMNADAKDVEETLNQLVSAAAPRKGSQPAGAQTSEIQPFEKDVSITHYEQTNALVILASPQDYKRLKPIIARLDVPQRQVGR